MRVAVIADDLTGANAAGICLSRKGFSTATMIEEIQDMPISHYEVICVNTDTRYSARKTAQYRVKQLTNILLKKGAQIFCKRIDSTVRGNIGTEIDAILDQIGQDSIAIVVPAFPESGRTMVGGYLIVNGIPVQETDVAKDPIFPLKQSYVPEIIEKQSVRKISLIDIGTVLQGKERLMSIMQEHIQNGQKILVVDAVTSTHIELIADAMTHLPFRFVPVDPGPLSAAYASKELQLSLKEPQIIISIGSCTSLSKLQLMYCVKALNISPIYVSPYQLTIDNKSRESEIARGITEGLERSQKQKPVIISTISPEQDIINLKSIADIRNITEEEVSKSITDGLAEITCGIINQSQSRFSGIYSSGGDVTASLCRLSYVQGIELIDEVIPLAAYGKLIGGKLNGIHIVTKGGLIGKEQTMYDCVKFLKNKITQEQQSVPF